MTRDHGMGRGQRTVAAHAPGASSASTSGRCAVLGEEDVLEVRLAADDIDEAVRGCRGDDRAERPADAHRDDRVDRGNVLDAGHTIEDGWRDRRPERQLDVMEGQSRIASIGPPGRAGPRG